MNEIIKATHELSENGFSMISNIYSEHEVQRILAVIEQADTSKETFRKSSDLFAIRQFLKELPDTSDLIFNERLRSVVRHVLGEGFFVVKSIYFDKPESSNWYVPRHQDLTISVDKKLLLEGFGPWTIKQQQFAVQPPIDILEHITTVRIHLDDTDEDNGALKLIPGSHLKKIYRPETIDWNVEVEQVCAVERGGVMLMRPLTMHSSARTTNSKKRRVIHIEFSNHELPSGLEWAERMELN